MKMMQYNGMILSLLMSGVIIACPVTVLNDSNPKINATVYNLHMAKDTQGYKMFLAPGTETTFGKAEEDALFNVVLDNASKYEIKQVGCLKGQRIVMNVSEIIALKLSPHLKDLFVIKATLP